MKRNSSFVWLLLLFILSVSIRLPHLNRPLSKHHEFNTAVVLIGLESWKQAGGAQNFHYVPLLTYQNPADRLPRKYPYTDRKGNLLYLSIGPAWYIIPYILFSAFNIAFTPLALQVLNLFFLLLSVLLLYRFMNYLCIAAGYKLLIPILAACFAFLFNPCILWFMGNGYVCTGIVLPFLIIILHYGIKMLYEPLQINTRNLFLVLLAGVSSIYIDWYGVSFLTIISISALLKIRKHKRYWVLFCISSLAIFFGIGIIVFQFASYAGWQTVYEYWNSRYAERGLINPEINRAAYLLKVLKHIITGLLPVLLTLLIGYFFLRRKFVNHTIPQPFHLALKISLFACLIHTAIFLNWSGAHDFAVIPYSIFLSVFSGWMIQYITDVKYISRLAIFLFLFTAIQYYYINFPGPNTITGLPYNSYQKTGNFIRTIASHDERIFCNSNYMIYQFYAQRNFTNVSTYEEAIRWSRINNVRKGVWIKINETTDQILIEEVQHFK